MFYKNTSMKIFLIALCLSTFFFGALAQPPGGKVKERTPPAFPAASQLSNANLTYKIVPVQNNTWCYNIYAGGRLLIQQSSIPGMAGNDGFKTKSGAEKVAQLVISKIKKGEMPPTVEIQEMKKLKAI
jgi:hypothetical protein